MTRLSYLSQTTPRSKLQHSREACKAITAEKISEVVRRLHVKIQPSARQQNDWDKLQQALLNETEFLSDICEKQRLGLDTRSAPARMELLAAVKLMENESLARLQPHILRLYLKLDEQQRIDFDRVFNWHYHGYWL